MTNPCQERPTRMRGRQRISLNLANGPNTVSDLESTVSNTELSESRKRVEYGFGEYGFKHRTQ